MKELDRERVLDIMCYKEDASLHDIAKINGGKKYHFNKMSPKNFEARVKQILKKAGNKVIRGDYKNKIPDFISFKQTRDGLYFEFVECKTTNIKFNKGQGIDTFLKSWFNKQREQVLEHLDLSLNAAYGLYIQFFGGEVVYLFFAVREDYINGD